MKLAQSKTRLTVLSACLVASQMLGACRSRPQDGGSTGARAASREGRFVYTRVCLHTEYRGGIYKAYSTNYIGVPDKFPAGSRLKVLEIDSDEVVLFDPRSGREIHIDYVEKHNLMPVDAWFNETFSDTAVSLPKLSAEEKENVTACRAQVGMSRSALFLALGYPPASLTPARQGLALTYDWKRFNRRVFLLDGSGKVTAVRD
jgi:hypothetical protein